LADISEKIIAGCKKGDRRSQEELYRILAPGMYGICLKYADNKDDAKDFMQEGFIKVFQKIEQYRSEGSFEGWVKRIMINTALEKLRSNMEVYSLDEKANYIEDSKTVTILETLSAGDLLALVQQLTTQYRIVFNLFAIEGYNHREISEMLGISEGTSKSNLSRARSILQEKVLELYKIRGEAKKNV
jgi:RNA polymerase sigma-70 factor (ECF subfamily)